MEMPAKQTPAASSEMVKLIRKLRWVGLEEKAEQLEKELQLQPATDTVLAIQSETDLQRTGASLCTRGRHELAICLSCPLPAPNQHRAVAIRSSTRVEMRWRTFWTYRYVPGKGMYVVRRTLRGDRHEFQNHSCFRRTA